MPEPGSVVVVGGTSGLGLEVARHYAAQGREVVLSGRDRQRAEAAAAGLGGTARGIALDLAEPAELADRLAGIERVGYLVLAAIERDENTVRSFDLEGATRLATLKLVGYAETIHQLAPRLDPEGSVVLFGGRAKDRPYPGSTMVSTVNGGVTGLVHSLAVELAPVRCNAIHPGIVGDSPYWSAKGEPALEPVRNRTPSRRLVTMEDIVGAVVFLLENRSVNGENLHVDGGWLLL
jgi:NAD(P)-dependent dehydrogenase (short-subunit alcohol dehydrogenase family)